MATTSPTLPLFDEPATPSTKRWPDDKRGSASDEERQAHVARLKAAGELTFDPQEDLKRPWWETLTVNAASETLARYEREAQQSQSLAADLDPFDDSTDDDHFWATHHTPVNDGW